jgi:hypothetical protein
LEKANVLNFFLLDIFRLSYPMFVILVWSSPKSFDRSGELLFLGKGLKNTSTLITSLGGLNLIAL